MARYDLPVVPSWVPPSQQVDRASASTLNNQAGSMSERTLTIAGLGSVIPIVYGEDRLAGVYVARPFVDSNGGLCMAIAWSDAAPYGIEGVQTLYIDGALATHQGSGNAQLYIQHYNGLQTTVDPMLAARYSGFTDTFNGVAYSAIRIPTRATGGFPNIEAVVRGRKILDTRTSTVAFSANPALCIFDFYTYQTGGDVIGEEAVANRCDILVSGQPRCRIGLTLRNAAQIDTHIETLAAYAECLWGYRGESLLLIPDAPVDTPALKILEADIRDGSWEPSGADRSQIPTSVTINYILPTITGEAWSEKSERAELAGVTDGTIDDITSSVSMPGIHRSNEAARKAWMRLKRLQLTGRVAFQMHDNGIQVEVGDVVELPDNFRGLGSQWIRVLSNQMVGLGIYQITAEVYSASVYDDSAPIVTGGLPVGAIIPVIAGAVPAGFTRFTAADGRYLLATSSSGATGGSNLWSLSGTTSTTANHLGKGSHPTPTSIGSIGPPFVATNSTPLPAGGHAHIFSILIDITDDAAKPPSLDIVWAKNVSETTIPINSGVLAAGELLAGSNLLPTTEYTGRLLRCGSTTQTLGTPFPRLISFKTSLAGKHNHLPHGQQGKPGTPFYGEFAVEAGEHLHDGTATVSLAVRGVHLALYRAMVTSDVVPGTIVGWESTSGPIPAGWRLCNGVAGAPDMTDRFILISSPTAAGKSNGQNLNRLTMTASFTSAGEHSHKGDVPAGVSYEEKGPAYLHINSDGGHSHSVQTQTSSAQLPHYTLMFIEYTG